MAVAWGGGRGRECAQWGAGCGAGGKGLCGGVWWRRPQRACTYLVPPTLHLKMPSFM